MGGWLQTGAPTFRVIRALQMRDWAAHNNLRGTNVVRVIPIPVGWIKHGDQPELLLTVLRNEIRNTAR
eukprot:7886315-Lingulodinium_polyedra.AAC.1